MRLNISQVFIVTMFSCLLSTVVYAAKQPAIKKSKQVSSKATEKSSWDGSKIQFGLSSSTGNTESENYNTQINIDYTKYRWTNAFQANNWFGKSDGNVNQEKYFFQDQINYSFNDNANIDNYVFVSGNWTFDRFSPYKYQSVYALGYGRDWVKTDRLVLNTQIGPGYRRNKERDTGLIEANYILTTQAGIRWFITKTGALSETVRYDIGRPYDYLKSVTAFTNKIVGNLAVQISYTVEHYSSIPANSTNTHKTDTTTNVALVYTF